MSRSENLSNDYLSSEAEALDMTGDEELSMKKTRNTKAKRSKSGNSIVKRMLEIPCDIIGFVLPFVSMLFAYIWVVIDIAKFYISGGIVAGADETGELDLIDSMLPGGWISLYGKKFVIFVCAIVVIECIFMIIEVFRKENWLKKTLFFFAIVIGLVLASLSLGLIGKFGFGLKLAKYLGISSFRRTVVIGGAGFVLYSMIVLLFCDGFKYLYYVMMVPAYCFVVLPFASVLIKTMPKSFVLVSVVIVIALLALMLIFLSMGYYRQKAAVISDDQRKEKKVKEQKKEKGKHSGEPSTAIEDSGALETSDERVAFAASAGLDDNYSFVKFDETEGNKEDTGSKETRPSGEIVKTFGLDATDEAAAAELVYGYENVSDAENETKANTGEETDKTAQKTGHFKEKCMACAVAVKMFLITIKTKCGIIWTKSVQWLKEKTKALINVIKSKLKKQPPDEVHTGKGNRNKKYDNNIFEFDEGEEHTKKTPAEYMKEAVQKNDDTVSCDAEAENSKNKHLPESQKDSQNKEQSAKQSLKDKTAYGWGNFTSSIKNKLNGGDEKKCSATEDKGENDLNVEVGLVEFDEISEKYTTDNSTNNLSEDSLNSNIEYQNQSKNNSESGAKKNDEPDLSSNIKVGQKEKK